MIKMLVQFILSGSIVVGATVLSATVGQKWAGLLVAAPLLTIITFIFLSIDGSMGDLRQYLSAALLFMVPAAVFVASLYLLSGQFHFLVNIAISLVIYSATVGLLIVTR